MLQVRLTNEVECLRREAAQFGQIVKKLFERIAKLILRRAIDCGARQFCLRARAKLRDSCGEILCHSNPESVGALHLIMWSTGRKPGLPAKY